MRLVSVEIKNFRCLVQVTIPFEALTVLIGENDCGKSSVLDLLEIVLNEGKPDENDYFNPEGDRAADSVEALLAFDIEPGTDAEASDYLAGDGKLYLRRQFTRDKMTTWYKSQKYDDARLHQDFAKMNVADLDRHLAEFGIVVEGKAVKEQKARLVDEYRKTAPRHEDWIEVSSSARLREILPRFERYRSSDYQSPDVFVMKTLRAVYESIIYETNEVGERQPVATLRDLKTKVDSEINSKVSELVAFVKRYNPRMRGVRFDATLDYSTGLKSGQFLVDDGRGLHYLAKSGDGTKRRLAMAAFDWDREVLTRQTTTGRVRPTIRGYDEPDANLHYQAQRTMYKAIHEIATQPGSRVQAVVCTHSMTMIDHAPARNVRLLQLSDAGETAVALLETDGDQEIEDFLSSLAYELGITNTLLFYERCYIVIEGPTEDNALPILYRRVHGHSLLEDGIRLINIEGNGGRSGLLKLLGKNRQALTLVLLDRDSKTGDEFAAAGFAAPVVKQQVIYIGQREFEDAFDDNTICLCLNQVWPRADGCAWSAEHLAKLRADQKEGSQKKFSDRLMNLIRASCECGPENRKPRYGKELAEVCPQDKVPAEITRLFTQARKIAGCE